MEKNINASWLKKSEPELPNDINSIGLEIDVYIYTIEKMVKEYLVNYNYLEKELSKYNIVPLSNDEMTSMLLPMNGRNKKCIGNFEDVYNFMKDIKETVTDDKLKRKIEYILDSLSEDEFSISKLNGYFMFIKKDERYVEEEKDTGLEELKVKYNKYMREIESVKEENNMKRYLVILNELTKLTTSVKEKGSDSMKDYNSRIILPQLKLLVSEYKKLTKK